MRFSKNIQNPSRKAGYYWIRIKRTKIWIISKWMPSYSQWDALHMFQNDDRGGYDLVCEDILIKPDYVEKKAPVKRIRVKQVKNKRRRTK